MVRRAWIIEKILLVHCQFCLVFIERCWCVLWWRHPRPRALVMSLAWKPICLFYLLTKIWRYRSYLSVRWRWTRWWCRIIDRVRFFDCFHRPWLWHPILLCTRLRRRHFIVSSRHGFRIWFSGWLGVWGWSRRICRIERCRSGRLCRSCCLLNGFIAIFVELARLGLYGMNYTLLLRQGEE